jgi:hypothetical protein
MPVLTFSQKSILATLLLSLALLPLLSCTAEPMKEVAPPFGDTSIQVKPKFDRLIERYSNGDVEYSGLYNNFEYKATILNSVIRDALVEEQTEYYQWDHSKTATERDKANKELASETQVFVSFYTPDRHNDNLADVKTIWQIYLDVGGRRYEGKAKRIKSLLAELQTLYPYHSRWNTPYMVSFAIPTSAIETQESTFTITGPLGTRAVKFPAVK